MGRGSDEGFVSGYEVSEYEWFGPSNVQSGDCLKRRVGVRR